MIDQLAEAVGSETLAVAIITVTVLALLFVLAWLARREDPNRGRSS